MKKVPLLIAAIIMSSSVIANPVQNNNLNTTPTPVVQVTPDFSDPSTERGVIKWIVKGAKKGYETGKKIYDKIVNKTPKPIKVGLEGVGAYETGKDVVETAKDVVDTVKEKIKEKKEGNNYV